jgi:hypothetical protein
MRFSVFHAGSVGFKAGSAPFIPILAFSQLVQAFFRPVPSGSSVFQFGLGHFQLGFI